MIKYFSTTLNATFDTEEECKKAEAEFKAKKEAEIVATKKAEAEKKAKKKELADNVDKAEEAVTQAFNDLEKAKKEAYEIIKPAQEALRKAQQDKIDAILEFRKNFGNYTKVYTGERALIEADRISKIFNNWFNLF